MEKGTTLRLGTNPPEQLINLIWRAMVGGFQDVDPMLATKWGVHQPAGFVGKDTSNPGLSMYCEKMALSITVEYNYTTGVYLISSMPDGGNEIEPITAVLTPEEIAPAIIQYMEHRDGF